MESCALGLTSYIFFSFFPLQKNYTLLFALPCLPVFNPKGIGWEIPLFNVSCSIPYHKLVSFNGIYSRIIKCTQHLLKIGDLFSLNLPWLLFGCIITWWRWSGLRPEVVVLCLSGHNKKGANLFATKANPFCYIIKLYIQI